MTCPCSATPKLTEEQINGTIDPGVPVWALTSAHPTLVGLEETKLMSLGCNAICTTTTPDPGAILTSDKTSAKGGESIIFSGTWPQANDDVMIKIGEVGVYSVSDHVVRTKSDSNKNFIAVGILPVDRVSTPTKMKFSACSKSDYWPVRECAICVLGWGCGYATNSIEMTISPGVHIPQSPPYKKTYPAGNSYSGPAKREYVKVQPSKLFSWSSGTFLPTLENTIFQTIAAIETAALQQGNVLLDLEVTSYTEDLTSYTIEMNYAYENPAPASVDGVQVQSMVAPIIAYAAFLVLAAVVAYFVVIPLLQKVEDLIYGPGGKGGIVGFLGIALVLGAGGYLLSKATPAIKEFRGSTV